MFSAAALAFWQGDCSIKEGTTGTNAGCRIALTMLVKEPSGCAQGGPFISMAQNSPVTGIIEEQAVIIDFGKYEGMTVSDIAKLDPDFYNRLATDKEGFAIRRHRDKTFRLYVNPLTQMDN